MIPLKDENPVSSFPFVTLLLITFCIISYLYQISLGYAREGFILRLGVIPYEITHIKDLPPFSPIPFYFTLFTSLFIHGDILHLTGNMLFLWIFGNNVEDFLGHIRFLIFYLLSGIIASITHILTDINSLTPMIGASGAIAGVLAAYLLLYPRAKILTLILFPFFIQIVRIPAVIFIGLWFVFQILSASTGGGIAWYAHIGGFVSGLVLINLFRGKRRRYR